MTYRGVAGTTSSMVVFLKALMLAKGLFHLIITATTPHASACRSHRVGPDAGTSTAVSPAAMTRGAAGGCGAFVTDGACRAVVLLPAGWRSNSVWQCGQRPALILEVFCTRKLFLQDGQQIRV